MNRLQYYSDNPLCKDFYSVKILYRQKIIMLSCLLLFYHILTEGHFLLTFIISLSSGLAVLLCYYDLDKIINNKLRHIYFLLLLYCFLPYWTPSGIYIVFSIFLILLLENFFYSVTVPFHPVIFSLVLGLIYIFYQGDFYSLFYQPYIKEIAFFNQFYTAYESGVHPFNISDFLWGISFNSPSEVGGLLVLLTFLTFKKFYQRNKVLIFYFLTTVMIGMILKYCFEIYFNIVEYSFKYNIMSILMKISRSNIFFIAIFIITEEVSSGKTYTIKKKMAVVSGLLLGFLMDENVGIVNNIVALILSYFFLGVLENRTFSADKKGTE